MFNKDNAPPTTRNNQIKAKNATIFGVHHLPIISKKPKYQVMNDYYNLWTDAVQKYQVD